MDYILIQKEQRQIQPDIGLLDEIEQGRYSRLRTPQKRLEFLTGRTLLKTLLADYTGAPPQAITLSITASGKPYLPALLNTDMPFFNMSHAAGYFVVALSRCPIGVDIEPVRSIKLEYMRSFLSTSEFDSLVGLPEPIRSGLFFQLFTAKEAFLKATDKRWELDNINFTLENRHWKLNTPQGAFKFSQHEHQGCFITVCQDRSPDTQRRL